MSVLLVILGVIGVIALVIALEALSAAFYMWIVNFIAWAFGLGFVINFWQGLAISIVISILGGIFAPRIRKE